MSARTDASTRIVIAGGGVAAIEAVLALRAAGADGLSVTLVSASPEFRLPPLSALKPFARGHSDAVDLAGFMASQGGEFILGRLATVEAARKVIVLADASEVAYDELLVAVGGQPVKGTEGALDAEKLERFADEVAAAVDRLRPTTLVMSGGDTALAILDRLGVDLVFPLGEAGAGLPFFLIGNENHPSIRCVVKSGGFGDGAALAALLPPNCGDQGHG